MAISFVGSATATNSGSLSLPGGMQEGDIVFVCFSADNNDGDFENRNPTGYTIVFENSSTTPWFGIYYKFMSASPDASVTIPDISGTENESAIAYVFRGVNQPSPLDTSVVFAEAGTGDPNCPSITTVSTDAVVAAFGFLDDDSATVSALTGYNNTVFAAGSNSTSMVAWKTVASPGAEDPPVFVTTGDDAWGAVSVALTPTSGGEANAAMSGAGSATAEAVGSAIAEATMNAAGAATAEAVGEAVALADGAMNGAGSATAVAEGASLADGTMSADGSATAIAESEGGIVIVVPDFTPVGGGGAIPPVRDRDKRFRIRKDKTQPHVIRVGDWPTEAQMAEMADALARAERQDFARFISGIQEPEPVEHYDEDEQALMLILAAA
jgi:hypothetical protein